MRADTLDHPVVIGIVGDSGAGKTTLAAGLAKILGRARTVTICTDDYHRYSRAERAKIDITPHDPACNYMDILEQHVYLLRDNQPILKPIYNHGGGTLDAPEYIEPKEFIILEGLLGYSTPRLRDAYDVKFYLEPEESVRLKWKFRRDTIHGGYTVEQLAAAMKRLNADSETYVVPQRAFADMVVGFYAPKDRPDEDGAGLSVSHILRPTLPHLDLAPVLEAGADKGFMLELSRDVDGRPVDALHVSGDISEAQAREMEDYLWSLIPGAPDIRPQLGEFRDANETVQISHSLALCQLMITHYLWNAALGHHAI